MRVTIYLSDGGTLDIEDLDESSTLDLKAELPSSTVQWLTFEMDDATVAVSKSHIVRIDFETGASS